MGDYASLMFTYTLAVQGPANERAVLGAVRAASASASFDRLRAAFAYASAGGAQLLHGTISGAAPDWDRMRKRWLVSFDWGHTEPEAIEFLVSLANSEVRVPYAEEVVARNLIPVVCFHPKTLILDRRASANQPPAALVVGSANMTVSGLATGHESASVAVWTPGNMSSTALDQLNDMRVEAIELDRIWRDATALTADLLRRYSLSRARRTPQSEDASETAREFERRYTEMTFDRTATLATAQKLWVDVGYVVPNLGRGRPGNQIDLARGTRVFFGFSGTRVPLNTLLGDVVIIYGAHVSTTHMRFGNNSMDKLNLPIPGQEGPPDYAHTTLLFERLAHRRFRLSVGSRAQTSQWKRDSGRQGTRFKMASGREYGVCS